MSSEYEVDNQTGVNHEGPEANRPLQRLTATTINSSMVRNREGEELGRVHDVMINLNTGIIEYVVLTYGSLLGVGGKLFAIPFQEFEVYENQDFFVLERDREELKKAPGFDASHWPATNDHNFVNSVDPHDGIVPPFP